MKTLVHVALPDNVCQQYGESIENPAPLKKVGDCLQVQRKQKVVNNLEFLISCAFIHLDLQSQIIYFSETLLIGSKN